MRLSHLTPEQRRAYVIADNQLAAKAGVDKEILAKELQGLMNLEFNIELTGFSLGEVDLIIGEADKLAGNGPKTNSLSSPTRWCRVQVTYGS